MCDGRDFQRRPTTTASAVLYGFTFVTASRDPALYDMSVRLAITPSSPAASKVSSQAPAAWASLVAGERRNPSACSSRNARRSASGRSCTGSPSQTSTSKAMNSAGISPARRLIRLSAGWRRICIRSNSTTPSRARRSSPSRFSSTPRKPSHLGSYCQPSPTGSSETSSASIGGKGSFAGTTSCNAIGRGRARRQLVRQSHRRPASADGRRPQADHRQRGGDDGRPTQVPVRSRGPLAPLPLPARAGGRARARRRRLPRAGVPGRPRARPLPARPDRCYKRTVSTRGVVVVAATVFLVAAGAASAAVTAEYFAGTLGISSDGADAIAVTCAAGTAKVNGADPEGDAAPCGAVESIEISGGPDANVVDLAAVTATAFGGLEYVDVEGGDGADTVTGSALADEIDGEGDDDSVRGSAGNDTLNGGDGDDRVFGGPGADTITAALGSDLLDGQAGSDTYRLDLIDLGPNGRIADSGSEGTDEIEIADCEGVTVAAGRISYEDARVTVSGIESYPCGFRPPATPPAPPPPPTAAKEACVVPRLRGRTLKRAKTALTRAHCSLGKVRRVRSAARRGVVVGQRPRAGIRKARGAKVALRISRGP